MVFLTANVSERTSVTRVRLADARGAVGASCHGGRLPWGQAGASMLALQSRRVPSQMPSSDSWLYARRM